MSLFYTSSKLVIFFTIISFVLSGNTLTAEHVNLKIIKRIPSSIEYHLINFFIKVFLIVTLFTSLRRPTTLRFPTAFAMAAEALVSIKRIEVTKLKYLFILK